jgi:hypothetical protein
MMLLRQFHQSKAEKAPSYHRPCLRNLVIGIGG